MPTYIYICEPCAVEWEELILISERDSPQHCPQCNGVHSYRKMEAPMVLKASHPDGYSRGEGYAEMKKIARLKVERANLPVGKRDDVNKEIGERTVIANKKRDKQVSKA